MYSDFFFLSYSSLSYLNVEKKVGYGPLKWFHNPLIGCELKFKKNARLNRSFRGCARLKAGPWSNVFLSVVLISVAIIKHKPFS